MSQRNLAWLLAVPALVAVGFVLLATAPPPEKDYQQVRKLVEVLAEVDQSYYRELSDEDKEKFIENMINGGLMQLDQHSMYFNEKEYQRFNSSTEGQLGGIGVIVRMSEKDKRPWIDSVLVNGPARKAGIRVGDIIVKVNDQSTQNKNIDDVTLMIKGNPQTAVKLTIQRSVATEPPGREEKEFTITRAIIELHPVAGYNRLTDDPEKWNYLADPNFKIGLIRLTGFNRKSFDELTKALTELQAAEVRGLILDMRGNPGGLLSQAISIADLFLDRGTILSTEGRRGSNRTWTAQESTTKFRDKPMIVLLDRNSASASEIVAAALQENERAEVMGERSFGKGSVQDVVELAGGKTALKLTIEIWKTPQGRCINREPHSTALDPWGVRPNPGLDIPLTTQQRQAYEQSLRLLDRLPGDPQVPQEIKAFDLVLDKAVKRLQDKLSGKVKKEVDSPHPAASPILRRPS